jgi:divalent anion:Na+ symporter, DASS family
MAPRHSESLVLTLERVPWIRDYFTATRKQLSLLLGPVVGCVIWLLPLGLEPVQQKAVAIVLFMIIYWIAEPIDHGLTALIGIYLFWALQVVKFSIAFSGFVNSTTWFLFSSLLMAEAAARTGLAKRIGFLVMSKVGSSPTQLLYGLLTLSIILTFFVPSGMGRIAIIAPLTAGILPAWV